MSIFVFGRAGNIGSEAQAVAVRDGRIVAVGSSSEIQALAGRSTKVIEVGGRRVLPGFVDAHSHTNGVRPEDLDLTHAASIAEVQKAVADRVARITDRARRVQRQHPHRARTSQSCIRDRAEQSERY